MPERIRSDNGSEFTAKAVREWLGRVGVKTLYIEPGSPWENGYCESFKGKPRDELLTVELSGTLTEAQVLVERWRRHYSTVRPHSALGYQPPAPEAVLIGNLPSPIRLQAGVPRRAGAPCSGPDRRGSLGPERKTARHGTAHGTCSTPNNDTDGGTITGGRPGPAGLPITISQRPGAAVVAYRGR